LQEKEAIAVKIGESRRRTGITSSQRHAILARRGVKTGKKHTDEAKRRVAEAKRLWWAHKTEEERSQLLKHWMKGRKK